MNPSKIIVFFILISVLLLLPVLSHSQMFSVEEPEIRARPSNRALSFGMEFIDMNFRPDVSDVTIYSIDDPVYRIRLDMPGIEIYAGYGTRLGNAEANADTLSYLNIGGNLSTAMPVVANRKMGILIPLWLSSEYTHVQSSLSDQPESEQFQQSSLSIGLGAGGYYRISDKIRISAELIPQIGITVTALGSDSGQITSWNGRVRFYRDQIVNRFGLVAGYDYNWRRYSGSDVRLLYDISSHNLTLGISF